MFFLFLPPSLFFCSGLVDFGNPCFFNSPHSFFRFSSPTLFLFGMLLPFVSFSFPSQFFSNWPLQGCVLRTTLTWNVDRSISLAFKRGDEINRTTENTWQPYSADLLLTYYMTTNQLTFFPTYYYCYTILLFHYSSPSILSVSSSFFTDRNNFVFFFFFFFCVRRLNKNSKTNRLSSLFFFMFVWFGIGSCAAKTKKSKINWRQNNTTIHPCASISNEIETQK